jgi:hypothetical protein
LLVAKSFVTCPSAQAASMQKFQENFVPSDPAGIKFHYQNDNGATGPGSIHMPTAKVTRFARKSKAPPTSSI